MAKYGTWAAVGAAAVATTLLTGFSLQDGEDTKGAGDALAPLHDEHQRLLPHIEHLREAGDSVGTVPAAELREQVKGAHEFLAGSLIPHAKAEDEVLYPQVDRVLGGVPVTATMRRDHVEVGALTERLETLEPKIGSLDTATEQDLREVLYGVYAVVKLHFAKEEEVYVPLLRDKLTEAEATQMMEDLEQAATKYGGGSEHQH